MAKAPEPRNPAGSSVSDMLRTKYTKKVPDKKLRHGRKSQDIEGVRNGMSTAADLMFRNEDDAYYDFDLRMVEQGWKAGGGGIDILGDKKGPPVPKKKVAEGPKAPPPPKAKPRLDTGYAAQTRKKIPPYKKPAKIHGAIPPMKPKKKPVRTGLKTYGQQLQ